MFDTVGFRMFRGTLASWAQLFADAANFAFTVRPEELISIPHPEDGNDGAFTVWCRAGLETDEDGGQTG